MKNHNILVFTCSLISLITIATAANMPLNSNQNNASQAPMSANPGVNNSQNNGNPNPNLNSPNGSDNLLPNTNQPNDSSDNVPPATTGSKVDNSSVSNGTTLPNNAPPVAPNTMAPSNNTTLPAGSQTGTAPVNTPPIGSNATAPLSNEPAGVPGPAAHTPAENVH